MKLSRVLGPTAVVAALMLVCAPVQAQCDPEAVDFGEEPWGLSPDGEETFFEVAEVGVAYTDDVHLLVPSC